jgi:hypothetical protein
MGEDVYCPVCRRALSEASHNADVFAYQCTTCGRHRMDGSTRAMLPERVSNNPKAQALLGYALRKMQRQNDWPMLTPSLVDQILQETKLPSVPDQQSNLIVWLAEAQEKIGAGENVTVDETSHQAIIGAHTPAGVTYILQLLEDRGLTFPRSRVANGYTVRLTHRGWERYEELTRGAVGGRKAFMAMPFGIERLNRRFRELYRDAVKQAGFDLVRLDDEPKAGLIDDRLRVEILTARFLVAELTEANAGAYWEAGYAEGQGKPVIYLCEEAAWKTSHFDTNHRTAVIWRDGNDAEAMEQLKAMIRVTLPAEAKLMDD